jgi:arsenate reductase (thioredoxin)
MTATPTVLFVCVHGSARSLIAHEHCRRLAQQRGVEVRSDWAGIEPDAEIPPRVIQGLLGEGIDVRGRQPRQVPRADLDRASRVVTFSCEFGALEPSRLARERWDDVPAVSEGYTPARDTIVRRLSGLVDDLGAPAGRPS